MRLFKIVRVLLAYLLLAFAWVFVFLGRTLTTLAEWVCFGESQDWSPPPTSSADRSDLPWWP